MIICPTCGWKNPRKDYYERHLLTHSEVVEEPTVVETPVEVPVEPIVEAPVEVVEPVVEVVPEVVVEPVVVPEPPQPSNKIVLNFSKPVEIFINGIPYFGKSVETPNMATASEVVRIAREAYGPNILL